MAFCHEPFFSISCRKMGEMYEDEHLKVKNRHCICMSEWPSMELRCFRIVAEDNMKT